MAFIFFIATQSANVDADGQITDNIQSVSRESKMENLLAAEDWFELGKLLKNPKDQTEFDADLMWLQRKTFEGKSAFLSLSYGAGLWYVASAISDENQKRQVQSTSLLIHLYAIAASNIDGAQCVDRTAPQNRIEQIMRYTPEIWTFAASLSDEERTQKVNYVVEVDKTTAEKPLETGDANFLCKGGMSQITFGLANGTTREVAPEPSQFGRQIKVDDGGKFKPELVSKEEWGKIAATRRVELRTVINTILNVSKKRAPK